MCFFMAPKIQGNLVMFGMCVSVCVSGLWTTRLLYYVYYIVIVIIILSLLLFLLQPQSIVLATLCKQLSLMILYYLYYCWPSTASSFCNYQYKAIFICISTPSHTLPLFTSHLPCLPCSPPKHYGSSSIWSNKYFPQVFSS